VSLTSKSVFADHFDINDVYAVGRARLEEAVICLLFVIQSTAAVTLLNKLAIPGLGVVWLAAGALCIVLAAMNPLATLKGAAAGWPFLLLAAWATLSTRWTVDSYETTRASLLLWAGHIFAFMLASKYSLERIITLLAITLCSLVAVSLLLAVAMPSVGQMQELHQGAWSGVWAEKQGMGIYASHALVASLAMVWRGPHYRWWWLAIIMCAIAIIGSTSKTALMMTFLSLVFGLWLRVFYRGVLSKVVGTWVAAIGAILIIPIATGSVDIFLKVIGKSSDLTGRTDIWEAVQKVADMRPLTGWGYQAIFRGGDDLTSPFQWITESTGFLPANAHSSWLDTYLQLGSVGVILLAISVIWAWAGVLISRKMSNASIAFVGATLASITFISFTETNLVAAMELQWILFIVLACKLFLPVDASEPIEPAHEDGPEDDIYTYSL
jgi:exopolysaccharide production protein ExoQ